MEQTLQLRTTGNLAGEIMFDGASHGDIEMIESTEERERVRERVAKQTEDVIMRAVGEGLEGLDACEQVLKAATAIRNRINAEKYANL